MSLQGPVVVIAGDPQPELAELLVGGGAFPIIDAHWDEASAAIENIQPNLVLADIAEVSEEQLADVAAQVAQVQPYLPLITLGTLPSPPPNAIPFDAITDIAPRLQARLSAALRVRSLHATVLRRIADQAMPPQMALDADVLQDATILLIGRAIGYPALSVAAGERMGVVGALSIEAAAKHLNTRDIDGIILSEGFSTRVASAFLTVLAEDARFRNIPVIVSGGLGTSAMPSNLPNLEAIQGSPTEIVANAIPLIRQHTFEVRLARTLKSLDADGLLDPRTGLLIAAAFEREFTQAIADATERGSGLSAARFWFEDCDQRTSFDAARILSRLMRKIDFACYQDDGSVVVAFTETDLRTAHVIARRLASILKHTVLGRKNGQQLDPNVMLATLKANDSAEAMLGRLRQQSQRAAS